MDEFLPDEEIERIIDEDSIYSEEGRNRLLENDELSPVEVAFMEGYDNACI
ncbi:hypothetical protein KY347_00845 [Candidatus Woesearchaeota archaeon]|nr:hypothetical protein [Candidatus Woesearchaeota archaeon]